MKQTFIWNGYLTVATWIVLYQALFQGWRTFEDLKGPRDARGWVPAEHLWAFLALAIIFFCLSKAYSKTS